MVGHLLDGRTLLDLTRKRQEFMIVRHERKPFLYRLARPVTVAEMAA